MIDTVTVMTDDLDGKTRAGVQTRTFSLDGTTYELELGRLNYKRLQDALRLYIAKARPVSGRPATKANGTRPKARRTVRTDTAQVRAWALAERIEGVRPLGRLAAEVYARYDARTAA